MVEADPNSEKARAKNIIAAAINQGKIGPVIKLV